MKPRSNTIRIKIIGLPTAKVRHAVTNATASLSHFDNKPRIQWVNDIQKVASMGALVVPTVLINDKLKSAGRIPSVYEFETWIEEEMQMPVAAEDNQICYSN
jgi:predicted DsbA family dithiol-disulfide isomerase